MRNLLLQLNSLGVLRVLYTRQMRSATRRGEISGIEPNRKWPSSDGKLTEGSKIAEMTLLLVLLGPIQDI